MTLNDITADQFIRECLAFESQRQSFLDYSYSQRLGLIANFIIGDESERFTPAPVYAVTGVGNLKSKEVDDMIQEQELLDWLQSDEGKQKVAPFLASILKEIT